MLDGVTVRIMADAKSPEDRHNQLYIYILYAKSAKDARYIHSTSVVHSQEFLGYCEPFRVQMQKYYTSRSVLSQFWELDDLEDNKVYG